jgi:hypothetical protein
MFYIFMREKEYEVQTFRDTVSLTKLTNLFVTSPQYTQDLENCQVGEMMSRSDQVGILPELSFS